ncbi:hypothetical protein ACYZX9_02130 [Sphingomonas citri]|jgi:hypothetical protein
MRQSAAERRARALACRTAAEEVTARAIAARAGQRSNTHTGIILNLFQDPRVRTSYAMGS